LAESKQTTRLLLAEDDALLGDGLRAELRQLGFQVDWVRDGEAAERELRAGDYKTPPCAGGNCWFGALHPWAGWQ